jgi:hypothetical protein
MAQRAKQLEHQNTEVFPVPGWEDLIGVELRSLGVREHIAIEERNAKITRDDGVRIVHTIADKLLRATTGFHQRTDDGWQPLEGDTWQSLARSAFGAAVPEDASPRVALLKLVGEQRIRYLISEWEEWAASVRSSVDEDVARDFEMTP